MRSQNIEQQLYSGGFISNADTIALERFHQVAPENKLHVVGTIGDARLTYLAERLIYEEWPAVLPLDTRDRFDAELRDRHLALTDLPWTTVSAALEAIEKLLPSADATCREILTDYQWYLKGLLPPEEAPPLQVDAALLLHASPAMEPRMSPL